MPFVLNSCYDLKIYTHTSYFFFFFFSNAINYNARPVSMMKFAVILRASVGP